MLFDTGAKPEVLTHNAASLRVDLGRLDAVVLSHDHGDHTAGFPPLGQRPGLPVFYARGSNPAAVGGFHLLQTPAEDVRQMVAAFRETGVGPVGPTHCTGPDAIRLFKEAYGKRFIPGGVGTVVTAGR